MKQKVNIPDFHGSDVDAVAQHFQLNAQNIINFAANVNPLGISPLLKNELANNLDVICQYPERDYHSLRSAISSYVHADMEHIIVGNGSTELISGVIHSIKPKEAVLIAPSYSEYERELSLCGSTIKYHTLRPENNFELDINALIADCSLETGLIILCNPNNPTSNAITISQLKELLTACESNNIFVMIDETYIEFSEFPDRYEAITLTPHFSNLVVLRGVSKFFAAPGLRLGYAICSNENLRNQIAHTKDPWTINSIAAKAGEIMFQDTAYITKTKELIQTEKKKLTKQFTETGKIKVYPSESNFLLLELQNTSVTANDCFVHCAKKELLIRDCSSFASLDDRFVRMCIMLPEDNQKVVHALQEIL